MEEYVVHYTDWADSDIRVVSFAVFETLADGKRFVMTNTHPAPHAQHYSGHMAELNRILTALLTVTPESCPLIEFHHTEAVTVCLEEPTSWSLDGEEASCGKQVTIRCLPGAVSLRACPDL
jgi:diacylglycerol kinase family enzyme